MKNFRISRADNGPNGGKPVLFSIFFYLNYLKKKLLNEKLCMKVSIKQGCHTFLKFLKCSGRKKMFLKFEIAKSVLEMFLNFKKYHIFSKKIPYLKRLSKILTYSTIFINLIEQINFIYMLKLSPETEF